MRAWTRELKAQGLAPEFKILHPPTEQWSKVVSEHEAVHPVLNWRIQRSTMPPDGLPVNIKPLLAANIRTQREHSGLTVEALAYRLSVAPMTVYRWEEGSRTPDVNDLNRLAAVYGMSPGDFFPTAQDIKRALRLLRKGEGG